MGGLLLLSFKKKQKTTINKQKVKIIYFKNTWAKSSIFAFLRAPKGGEKNPKPSLPCQTLPTLPSSSLPPLYLFIFSDLQAKSLACNKTRFG